ncbi:MAG: OsmC family protein [Bacteroidetes bacterium]|nr:OsmC family protein [Bacteroidota bacterium]
MKVQLQRLDDAFKFEAKSEEGNSVIFDIAPEQGGKGKGIRPMQSLLMALGGCSAVDIIIILKKQKQEITDFRIEIDGEREKEKEPALWQDVHVIYHLDGTIEPEKAKRAVQLSMEKYCSVAATLEKADAKITWEVRVNGNLIS